jgi:hypothetical protein
MGEECEEASMGAMVLGCGHASQLFKVEYLEGSPQVHLHYLTDDDEFDRDGHGKIEFVCHGCGDSMLLRYDSSGSRRRFLAIRNRFRDAHLKCRNIGFEQSCPDYRRNVDVMDVRKPAQHAPKRASVA